MNKSINHRVSKHAYCYMCGRAPADKMLNLFLGYDQSRPGKIRLYGERPHCNKCARAGYMTYKITGIVLLASILTYTILKITGLL